MIRLILAGISFTYLIWIYSLLITKDTSKKKSYGNPLPVSVIIPCFNEKPKYLKDCVDSVINTAGKKQVILVNNNSNNEETIKTINSYRDRNDVEVIDEFMQGKRMAQDAGLKIAKYDIILFTDSDTVLEKNALTEISKLFIDKRVGGVTGKMIVANKNDSFVSKMLSAMFWTSSEIFRKSTASVGYMQVMPGPLAAFRREDLKKLWDGYLNQKFLGRKCSVSDDRYLTMRIQSILGHRIEYTSNAVAKTYVPTTFIGTWKMMERWKRGMTREVLLQWFYKQKNKTLFLDTQLNFFMFNAFLLIKLMFIVNFMISPSVMSLGYTLGYLVMVSILWGIAMVFQNPREMPYKILYSFFYEFFWSFTYIQAIFRIRNQGAWSTR